MGREFSRAENVEELARRHDADALVLLERQQATVSGDDDPGATLKRGGNILVVVRILADAGRRPLAGHEISQHNDILDIDVGVEDSAKQRSLPACNKIKKIQPQINADENQTSATEIAENTENCSPVTLHRISSFSVNSVSSVANAFLG